MNEEVQTNDTGELLRARVLAKQVLRSQGHAVGLVDGMPKETVDALAAFTTPEGAVRSSAVAGVPDVLRKYYAR